jgi:hypothetical protein
VPGIGAGTAREVGEVVLPAAIRRSQLYRNLVDTTLRFLIERVGGAEGICAAEALPHDRGWPYVDVAVRQFSSVHRTITERVLDKLR